MFTLRVPSTSSRPASAAAATGGRHVRGSTWTAWRSFWAKRSQRYAKIEVKLPPEQHRGAGLADKRRISIK